MSKNKPFKNEEYWVRVTLKDKDAMYNHNLSIQNLIRKKMDELGLEHDVNFYGCQKNYRSNLSQLEGYYEHVIFIEFEDLGEKALFCLAWENDQ